MLSRIGISTGPIVAGVLGQLQVSSASYIHLQAYGCSANQLPLCVESWSFQFKQMSRVKLLEAPTSNGFGLKCCTALLRQVLPSSSSPYKLTVIINLKAVKVIVFDRSPNDYLYFCLTLNPQPRFHIFGEALRDAELHEQKGEQDAVHVRCVRGARLRDGPIIVHAVFACAVTAQANKPR